VSTRGLSTPNRVGVAVFKVILELDFRDPLKGSSNGRDLTHDIDTVPILIDHPHDAVDLASDRFEAILDIDLQGRGKAAFLLHDSQQHPSPRGWLRFIEKG